MCDSRDDAEPWIPAPTGVRHKFAGFVWKDTEDNTEVAIRDGIDHARWLSVFLKLEEAEFFLKQVRAHVRVPKLLLFYLSAFLSSARATTFHIQKQICPKVPGGREVYDQAKKDWLSGAISAFFVTQRNVSEKEMYIPLSFKLVNTNGGGDMAGSQPRPVSKEQLMWLEEVLLTVWPRHGGVEPKWYLEGCPSGPADLLEACEAYLRNLNYFVDALRVKIDGIAWESG